jgi:hypothetical protein
MLQNITEQIIGDVTGKSEGISRNAPKGKRLKSVQWS